DHALGNTADDDMSQAGATVRGEYNQINRLRAGVADDLHLGRPLGHGPDDFPTDRPLRVKNAGQGLFRRRPGLVDVLREGEAHAEAGRGGQVDLQRVQQVQFRIELRGQFAGVFRGRGGIGAEVRGEQDSLDVDGHAVPPVADGTPVEPPSFYSHSVAAAR